MRTAVTISTKAILAFPEVSYVIAKNKKPHTTCEIMHAEKYGEALKIIPFSNNTVMRRIESMSEDIKEQLLTRLNAVQNLLFKSTNQQMLQD
jgi:hypothetical protein